MIVIMSIMLGIYVVYFIKSANRFSVQSINKISEELRMAESDLNLIREKEVSLSREKLELSEEAIRVFTLYEITREITKSLNEKTAFEIFEQKLIQNVHFEECRLLEADSKEIRALKKQEEIFLFSLKGKGRRIGYLAIKGVREEDREKVIILGQQFALALRRVQLYQKIERIAITDGLTEVHTRRYVLERLDEEIRRSRLRKIKMAILMIDVDFFKSFNDKYGHLAGDQILREIADIIKDNIREIDIAGRYGGEEFFIVLPDTDLEGAKFAAERIRSAAEKTIIHAYDAKVTATVSIGIATFPKDAGKMDELIDKADWTLYRAKKLGRNKVCAYGVYDGSESS